MDQISPMDRTGLVDRSRQIERIRSADQGGPVADMHMLCISKRSKAKKRHKGKVTTSR